MLDGEDERVLLSADVEVGVTPRVEVATAAESESRLRARRAVLAGVMDDEDGDVELPLKGAEIAEESGDLAGVVLVDAVESNEGIEDEEAGSATADGIAEARLIATAIETQNGDGDDVDGHLGEVEAADLADATKPRLDDGAGVLGHVEQDGASVVDVEGAEARGAGCDGDGEVESEPGLAALGSAAEDADGGAGPERLDEPAGGAVAVIEVGSANDGEGVVVEMRGRGHALSPSSSTAD